MSKAEEAAGQRYAELCYLHAWGNMPPDVQNVVIAEAMSIVAAHDAERWRVPRDPDDWTSWKDALVIYWFHGQWCGPFYGPLQDIAPAVLNIHVMIADPIPLPPAPGGGEG